MWRGSAIGLAVSLALGSMACTEFNDSCPVVNPEVWGEFNRDLDISPETVARCEAPIGNFLADALLGYPYELRDTDSGAPISVRVALINAGSISDTVTCGEVSGKREVLSRGVVTDQDVAQLLPGGDQVVLIRLRGGLIKSVMERAVSQMDSAQDHFLQAAAELGIQVEVDCSGTAQGLSVDRKSIATPGTRIVRIHIGDTSVIDPADPNSLEGIFYLATLSSLVETDAQGVPNLGFVGFQDPGVVIFESHVSVVEVVHWWLEEYPRETDYPVEEGRLDLTNCPEASGCVSP